MEDQSHSSLSIIKRAAMQRQQQYAAWDATEIENARWPNRLKHAVYSGLICTLVMSLLVLGTAFPWLYPKDLEGLGILIGVSLVLSAYFVASFYVQEWVEDRRERYWFWRITSVVVSLMLAGVMLYGMFVTSTYWLQHFR